MTRPVDGKGGQPVGSELFALLAVAIFAPLTLARAAALGLPEWLGGAVGLAALFAALGVLARGGGLRGRFLVFFALALLGAVVVGWSLGRFP